VGFVLWCRLVFLGVVFLLGGTATIIVPGGCGVWVFLVCAFGLNDGVRASKIKQFFAKWI